MTRLMAGRLRWVIISLIALVTVINYVDRNAMAIMWPAIAGDLDLTKQDYAFVLSVFMVFYAIGQASFGKIFDRIGTRYGFVFAIALWSVSIGMHALARTAGAFAALRATLAFGEAGNWPGATKANAEWFPVRERALAQGIFNAGASVGAIVAAPLIAWLFVELGWRSTFLAIGAVGLLWIVPWLLIFRAGPREHPWLDEEERRHIVSAEAAERADIGEAPGWFAMLRYRQSWAVILARFFIDPVWWLFVSWLPLYLADTFGFDVTQIGLFAWVPFVGAAAGSLFGGWLAGWLIKRGLAVASARKLAIGLGCLLISPSLLLASATAEPLAAVLLIAVSLFGFQVAIGNIQTLPSDYFPQGSVGSLAGISGAAAVIGVLITIWLVPIITRDSYAPFFVLGALLAPFSLAAVLWLARHTPRQAQPGDGDDVQTETV